MAKVLIIDDSNVVCLRVAQVLGEALGCEILHAADGTEGLKLMLENDVDVVLCDMIMPGMDGLEFLAIKRSKAAYEQTPVLMLTGEEEVEAKVKCLDAGASDYITKPFHAEELVARTRVHIQLKELRDQLLKKNEELERISRTDALTGIANRHFLMECITRELKRAERYDTPLAYMMVDLDHFKAINDSHGHQVGDDALRVVATVLQKELRAHDVVGRYGGEEFGVVLPETDIAAAKIVAERCRAAIAGTDIPCEPKPIVVTASIGMSAFPTRGSKTVADLIRHADGALYQAKTAGRNRVVAAEPR